VTKVSAGAANDDNEMPDAHRALPVLLRICAAIDRLFVVEVGPFGTRLAEDARAAWLATGNKNKPSDVEEYVALLAANIADREQRAAFIAEAMESIKL
jgi:hypothetical protein